MLRKLTDDINPRPPKKAKVIPTEITLEDIPPEIIDGILKLSGPSATIMMSWTSKHFIRIIGRTPTDPAMNDALSHGWLHIVRLLANVKGQRIVVLHAKKAAKGGIDAFKFVLASGIPVTEYVTKWAARQGSLETLKLVYPPAFPAPPEGNPKRRASYPPKTRKHGAPIMYAAIKSGSMECVQWLIASGMAKCKSFLISAAENNNVDMMKYFRSLGIEWDDRVMEAIGWYDCVDAFKYAEDNGCPIPDVSMLQCPESRYATFAVVRHWIESGRPMSEGMTDSAAWALNWEALGYLVGKGCPIPDRIWDQCANTMNALSDMKMLVKICGPPPDPWVSDDVHKRHVADTAVEHDELEVFAYIESLGKTDRTSERYANIAAEHASAHFLEYLHKYSYPFSDDIMCNAVAGDNLESVKFLISVGYQWTQDVTTHAIAHGSCKCLSYATKEYNLPTIAKCMVIPPASKMYPCIRGLYTIAVINRHIKCVEVVLTNGGDIDIESALQIPHIECKNHRDYLAPRYAALIPPGMDNYPCTCSAASHPGHAKCIELAIKYKKLQNIPELCRKAVDYGNEAAFHVLTAAAEYIPDDVMARAEELGWLSRIPDM